jgi:hypothetical protein
MNKDDAIAIIHRLLQASFAQHTITTKPSTDKLHFQLYRKGYRSYELWVHRRFWEDAKSGEAIEQYFSTHDITGLLQQASYGVVSIPL